MRLLPAVLVWLAFALLPQTLPGRKLELLGFDLFTMASAPARIDAPIVIVGIDEPSFAEIDRTWPWPRRIHARLVDALHAAGASVIAFDVLFPQASTPEDDRRLAEAIRRAGNVVLASDLVYQETGQYQQAMAVEPLPLFREAGVRSGKAGVTVDPDLVVRAIPRAPDAFWREVLRAYAKAQGEAPPRDPPGELIRYFGPDHSFRYVSYYQALDPAKFLPPDTFKGKIVLVGNDVKAALEPEATHADALATPYSGVTRLLTPGVEVHATLVADALAHRAVHEAPPWLRWAALALVVLVMQAGVGEWHALRRGVLALGLAAAVLALSAWLFAARDIWLPSIGIALGALAAYAVQVASGYLRELRQRRRIERAFRHYVSPEIVREMTEHPERLVLGGVRRELTVMFTDLAGFTGLSERMAPEQVAEFLNEYLTAMTRIVLAHGGTVDKFIGDAIMAFWGAPLADPAQALHACRAVQAMQQEAARLRERAAARGLPELRARIGVHSGAAVVGNMGSSDRFDYTAVGDNVNLASRLEGINKHYGTEVLISEPTAAQVAEHVPLRRVDRVIVKGRTRAIDIYTLCAEPEIAKLSDEALACYVARDWDGALHAWRRVLELASADPVAPVMIARVEELQRDPPPADWDGGTALEKL